MTEDERIDRLTKVLEGTGATVNDAFGIWALNSQLADHHIAQLGGWADLQYFMASGTRITDASLSTICSFRNLTSLCIGGNAVTANVLANCDLPPALDSLGQAAIPLNDDAVASVCRCSEITALSVNWCSLSSEALSRLSALPKLKVIEALGADSTLDSSKMLSKQYPNVLFLLRDGLWRNGECRRPPFPHERA